MESEATVFVIDDELAVREALDSLFRSVGLRVLSFGSVPEFLACKLPDAPACLVLDVRLPGVNGLDFHDQMGELGVQMPAVIITAHGDVPMSVRAMQAGAINFIIKPFPDDALLDAVHAGLARDRLRRASLAAADSLTRRFESLTEREKQILWLVVAGQMSKQIAAHLGLSEITVKVQRAQMMRKMKAMSLIDLVRKADILSRHLGNGALH
ncbi:response regulator [Bradyrhizobium sp. CIAT3101]|uniref:response regulator transcription factor n=1 Tax=Bradyrhizobium sp. CIAT3101 TaxID=439387 RepID=UPI0024B100A9|nr:response regulator [Bradyrhizobium sp. CIAT3101]WFU82475.1 response regulator [Bradyrhizobium sp. CIAT3101]